jgi:hypothetical protein
LPCRSGDIVSLGMHRSRPPEHHSTSLQTAVKWLVCSGLLSAAAASLEGAFSTSASFSAPRPTCSSSRHPATKSQFASLPAQLHFQVLLLSLNNPPCYILKDHPVFIFRAALLSMRAGSCAALQVIRTFGPIGHDLFCPLMKRPSRSICPEAGASLDR